MVKEPPWTFPRYSVSNPEIEEIVILASLPRTEDPVPTVAVTIPTISPTEYPFPGFTIVGVPVLFQQKML